MRNRQVKKTNMRQGRSRKKYKKEDAKKALQHVQAKDLTVAQASALYKIPVSTLNRWVAEGGARIVKEKTVLTALEEERLVRYMLRMSEMGLGLRPVDVCAAVLELAADRPTPFGKKGPGRDWMEGFLDRHPELSLRHAQRLSRARAQNDNKNVLQHWADLLDRTLAKYNFLPRNIWNVDETMAEGKTPRTFAERNTRTVLSIWSEQLLHTTIVGGINAAGESPMPPLLIYTGKNVMRNWTDPTGEVSGTMYAATENGWVTREVFDAWFGRFVEHVNEHRGRRADGTREPVLLIFDGHDSHISIISAELAELNDIVLLQLPAHTSHRLQPLDVSCFATWHKRFGDALYSETLKNPARTFSRDDLSRVMRPAWEAAMDSKLAVSGFRGTGIHPFDRARILGTSPSISPADAVSRLPPSPSVIAALTAPTPTVPNSSSTTTSSLVTPTTPSPPRIASASVSPLPSTRKADLLI
jgi:hypothetical protein